MLGEEQFHRANSRWRYTGEQRPMWAHFRQSESALFLHGATDTPHSTPVGSGGQWRGQLGGETSNGPVPRRNSWYSHAKRRLHRGYESLLSCITGLLFIIRHIRTGFFSPQLFVAPKLNSTRLLNSKWRTAINISRSCWRRRTAWTRRSHTPWNF